MTREYEMADDNRADLIFTKEDLLAPLLEGMVPAPHDMYPGADHATYYRGEITGAAAEQGEPYTPARDGPEDNPDVARRSGHGARTGHDRKES